MSAPFNRVAGMFRHFADARQLAIELRKENIEYKIESFSMTHIVFVKSSQCARARKIAGERS